MKKALITGVTGQDGSYLAELLLSKGYQVHGLKRRSSLINTSRIDHIYQDPHEESKNLYLHYGDLTDAANISNLVSQIEPDEIYNLGAQSHVSVSFDMPLYTSDVNALGTLRLLEAIRSCNQPIKFYQASSSEMFGKVQEIPQKESTPFYPRSPYGVSKLFGYWITVNYRESYGLFACNGILFNHESPRRGETFVTRKISRQLSRIVCGLEKKLFLGNLDSLRDWGHARDYVEMQWLMLQKDQAKDYVISTGKQISVREFVEKVACELGITISWEGSGMKEKGIIEALEEKASKHLKTGEEIIEIDERYFRPAEVDSLLGDFSLAKDELDWYPKTSIDEMVSEMSKSDLENSQQIEMLVDRGFKVS